MTEIETKLASSSYLSGKQPGAEDREVAAKFESAESVNPQTYPNVYGWLCSVKRFMPQIQDSWN